MPPIIWPRCGRVRIEGARGDSALPRLSGVRLHLESGTPHRRQQRGLGTRKTPLFCAGPEQITFLVPAGRELGPARPVVRASSGQIVGSGDVLIQMVAPGIFTIPDSPGGSGAILTAATSACGPISIASEGSGDQIRLSVLCAWVSGDTPSRMPRRRDARRSACLRVPPPVHPGI